MNEFLFGVLTYFVVIPIFFIPDSYSTDICEISFTMVALGMIVWTFVKGITRLVTHKTKEQTSAGIALLVLALLIFVYHAYSITGVGTGWNSHPTNYFYLSGFLYGTIAIFLLAFQPVFREGGTLRDMVPYRIPYCVLAGVDLVFTVSSMLIVSFKYGYYTYIKRVLFGSFTVTHLHICVVLLNLLALIVIPIVNWRLRVRRSRKAKPNTVQE